MEKIEERLGLCKHCLTDETRLCHTDCHFYSRYQGAKEQRKIDIEKACEWLSEHAFSWIDDNKVNEDTRKLKQQKIKELQDDFRKALEE